MWFVGIGRGVLRGSGILLITLGDGTVRCISSVGITLGSTVWISCMVALFSICANCTYELHVGELYCNGGIVFLVLAIL